MTFKKLSTVVAASLALSLGACETDLTSVNQNPNAPTDVGAEYLFPQGVSSVVGIIGGPWFDQRMLSLWAQHYAAIQYTEDGDTYQVRPGVVESTLWASLYVGGLQDLKQAEDKAASVPNSNRVAPAKIMRAWTFGVLTDLWGDIPYSQANKGGDADGTTTPEYDTQQSIYNSLFTELKAANDMIGTGTPFGNADPIYGGDMTKWKKFANSLRARHAMRLSKVDAAKAQAEFNAAMTDGVFTSNADNAQLVWPGDGTNDAPIYSDSRPPWGKGSRDDHRVSKALVDTLASLSDPRLAVYAACTQASVAAGGCSYVGVPNGLENPDAAALGFTFTSRIGDAFHEPNTPTRLMTYAEMLFLQAEAAQRGWTAGSAATLYDAAITASMQQHGVAAADIATYLAQPRVVYNAATGLTQIALQKWISLFGQGSEAWNEHRRTGVPTLTPGPAAITPAVPRRLTYPGTEQSFNKANLDAATARMTGGDDLMSRMWWDIP
ncbi:MAG: SusD/RagB family nutrient-binding outer membrane lipoprotein [Gemmatimonadaceae bacterium]